MNSKKISITYGIVLGMVCVMLFWIRFQFGFLYENTQWVHIVFDVPPIFIMLGCILVGIYAQKRRNTALTFSQMLKTGMGIVLIGALIIASFHVIFITYIDLDFMQKSMEIQLERIVQQQPEMTQEEYQQIQQNMQRSATPLAQFKLHLVKNLFLGFFLSMGISSLIKLLPKRS